MALTADGEITAVEIDDLTGIGPYSVYPRTSGIEANQVVNLTGAPYRHQQLPRPRPRRAAEQERDVPVPGGRPSDRDRGDRGAGRRRRPQARDRPAEMRRRNLIPDDAYPHTNPWGISFERLSHQAALAKLLEMMDYEALRAEQARLRAARHLSRHRACRVRRGDQPERRLLRRRRRPHLGAGRHAPRGSMPSGALGDADQRHRAGPGHRGRHGADRGDRVRRAAGARPGDLRRHRQHALWRRHLGLARAPASAARRRCRRPPRCAATSRGRGRRCCRRRPRASISATARSSTPRAAASACRSRSWRASPISGPTPCRQVSAPSWSRPATSCRATYPFVFTNGVQASYLEVDAETGFVDAARSTGWSRTAAR